ncbi:MAG: hypothetical protein APR54_07850 [Candidatus Cloacimonas sp. SDB]|nr:MAG: hypothetical protein APR54_07850 [Candidatus Cloacimonas sp. SDB]
MKYSNKKFRGFSRDKKLKVIGEFIREIEKNWQFPEKRKALLTNLLKCITWSEEVELKKIAVQLENVSELDKFLQLLVPWEQKNFRDLRDPDFLIWQKDGINESVTRLNLVVILHNLRSAFNVGNIMRTAECLGLEKIIFCGYTPTPENRKVKETSMGTHGLLDWQQRVEIFPLLEEYKTLGWNIYGLETTSNAENIFTSELPEPAVIVLGNEAHGIPRKVLEFCDGIIRIPTGGWKNSLNVGVAFAVAGYEILRKWKYRK